MTDQSFEEVQDILLIHESHFTVDLCKLRLTVCAQVFVTEALHNLVIPVEAGYHQQVFERLWRLGERVELSVMNP